MAYTTRLDLFKNLPKGARCAEIGVMAGDLMREIVTQRPDLNYIGVDLWAGPFRKYYEAAQRHQRPNAVLIRSDSTQAATSFPDNHFDLVYIDALHTRQAVLNDIIAWYPKVKPGGILAGHDYEMKEAQGGWEPIEVKEAVDFWAKDMRYSVNTIMEPAPSWWITRAQR